MLIEVILHFICTLTHNMLDSIVLIAVVPYELHIPHKLTRVLVEVMDKSLLDSPEIHRNGDYIEIVHYVEFGRIDWFHEVERSFLLSTGVEDLHRVFVPRLIVVLHLLLCD